MTNTTKNTSIRVVDQFVHLLPQHTHGGIAVSPESFAQFDLQMGHRLSDLVGQWEHLAAPCDANGALRKDRSQNR